VDAPLYKPSLKYGTDILTSSQIGRKLFCLWRGGDHMTADEYRRFLDTDFDDMNIKQMKDIRDIRIDRSLPREKRVRQYLRQVGNPYMVRVGNIKVKIRFANEGTSFEDAFEEMLLNT